MGILGGHRTLAFVKQLDVAAERNAREPILGGWRPRQLGSGALSGERPCRWDASKTPGRLTGPTLPPTYQRPAEADRKSQDLKAQSPRDPKVAELVHGHEYSNGDDKCYDGEYHF